MPGFCLHRMGKAQIAGSAHRGWGGGTCSGFAAPLNEPYGWFGDGGGFAACRGVLTLWCYAGEREGSALRAVAARLQAEQVPPPRVTFVDARAAEAAAPVRRRFAGWADAAAPVRRWGVQLGGGWHCELG